MLRWWVGLTLGVVALAGCGGGSGGEGGDTTAPGALQLSAGAQSVNEANGTIAITITRSGGSDGAVSATLATAAGTAAAGLDFTSVTTTVSFAAGDSVAKTVAIPISNDALPEPGETFTVTLSAASGGASLGAPASATITIQDDDTAPSAGRSLNDTGITTCSNGVNNGVACNDAAAGTDQYPEQDAQHGRDLTDRDDSDGRAGFSFTKLDANGAALPNEALSWACVRDNVTGLTWEVKTDDDGLRDKDSTFTWFASTGIDDGGDRGFGAGGRCADPSTCDTEKYVAAVNSALLCGRADWRLPARDELMSLADYGVAAAPFIVASHFPDLATRPYWSATSAGDAAGAVDFTAGETDLVPKYEAQAVRAVSGNRSR